MTTTMYDSTDALAIPGGAPAVAGYVDGTWEDWHTLKTDFAGRPVVSITVTGVVGARVGDVENGDLTYAGGAQWAKYEIAQGRRPTLYCNRSSWSEVAGFVGAAGIAAGGLDWWIADFTGYAHLLPGTVATQYASPATDSGGDYDLSVAVLSWLAPSIRPPIQEEEETMTSVVVTENGQTTVLVYCASPTGHLLEFSRRPGDNAWNSVIDITDGIGGTPPFLVAP